MHIFLSVYFGFIIDNNPIEFIHSAPKVLNSKILWCVNEFLRKSALLGSMLSDSNRNWECLLQTRVIISILRRALQRLIFTPMELVNRIFYWFNLLQLWNLSKLTLCFLLLNRFNNRLFSGKRTWRIVKKKRKFCKSN